MKKSRSPLTFQQRRAIERLADEVAVIGHREAVLALRVRHGGEGSTVPIGDLTLKTRRKVLRARLIEGAEAYLQGSSDRHLEEDRKVREQTRELLVALSGVLTELLEDHVARESLYRASDVAAGLDERGMTEDGGLVAKRHAEGRPHGIVSNGTLDDDLAEILADLYEQKLAGLPRAKPARAAWVLGYATELREAAKLVLGGKQFRRGGRKPNEALESLIGWTAAVIEWATGKKPAVNNREAGRPGDVVTVVEGILRALGRPHHSRQALAKKVQRTLRAH